MFTDINQRLEKAQEGIFKMQKIDAMLQYLSREQLDLTQKVVDLRDKLSQENMDVQKLEQKSLSLLFLSLLGNVEERLERERQEALAAKLSYGQAVSDLEEVKQEIFRLSAQRKQYADCQRQYDKLYSQKQEMLLQSETETAQELMDATEQVNSTRCRLKEIREALSAGSEVNACLERVLGSLGSAENWGVWDVLGGGLLADLAKHSHIDDAKAEAERTHSLLRRFNTELADVRIYGDYSFETGGFAKFADFFFDGLIADFVMQSRITNSRDSVLKVRDKVQAVLVKLKSMETQETEHIENLNEKISMLITES